MSNRIEIYKGWNHKNPNLKNFISGDEDIFVIEEDELIIDINISQHAHWPYISPIRVWRSFFTGALPIRFGRIRDDSHPLSSVIEQTNSIHDLATYPLFFNFKDAFISLENEIRSYNKDARFNNKKIEIYLFGEI